MADHDMGNGRSSVVGIIHAQQNLRRWRRIQTDESIPQGVGQAHQQQLAHLFVGRYLAQQSPPVLPGRNGDPRRLPHALENTQHLPGSGAQGIR